MKGNFHAYKDVLGYAEKMQTKAQTDFVLMAQSDFNKQNLEHRLTESQTVELLNDIVRFDHQYIDDTICKPSKSENIENYLEQPLCGVGLGIICVGHNGDVYPCSGWQGYVIGNLKTDSLIEIWQGSEKLQALRNIKMKDFPECIECDARDYCALCLVRNFNENYGNMFKVSDSHCRAAKLNKQVVESIIK
jgi:radical SAM protein with 4Fe4S-binding SPASM domain